MKIFLLVSYLFSYSLFPSIGKSVEGKWTLIECIDKTNGYIVDKEKYDFQLGTFTISFIEYNDTTLLFCGISGSNEFGGYFRIDSTGVVKRTSYGSTKRYEVSRFGAFFIDNIYKVNKIEMSKDKLIIYSNRGEQSMMFIRLDSNIRTVWDCPSHILLEKFK